MHSLKSRSLRGYKTRVTVRYNNTVPMIYKPRIPRDNEDRIIRCNEARIPRDDEASTFRRDEPRILRQDEASILTLNNVWRIRQDLLFLRRPNPAEPDLRLEIRDLQHVPNRVVSALRLARLARFFDLSWDFPRFINNEGTSTVHYPRNVRHLNERNLIEWRRFDVRALSITQTRTPFPGDITLQLMTCITLQLMTRQSKTNIFKI